MLVMEGMYATTQAFGATGPAARARSVIEVADPLPRHDRTPRAQRTGGELHSGVVSDRGTDHRPSRTEWRNQLSGNVFEMSVRNIDSSGRDIGAGAADS